ncbi:leukocyte immunoglobulin-like receptor subfamily B member 2 isoform X1 [Eretmochelys imbricata]
MVSALTILFLGCWLAGQSEVSRELLEPRPSISVSPSGVIVPGAAVTIRCQCRYEARRLFLYKDGIQIQELDAAGDGGEFTIPSARREDAGFYHCRSRSRSEPEPHDYLRIVVAELSYLKPNISLSPSRGVALGRNVTIRCECQCQKATFLMYKLGNPDVRRWAETAGGVAEFTIHNMSRRHTGSYSCQYGTKLDPSVWSHPSDPMELMVAGGTNLTQLITAPAPTHPGSAWPGTGAGGRKSPSTPPETGGTEPSAAPELSSPVIAGVSAAATSLLLLLGILCHRRTRGRKGPTPRKSRESKAAATVDTLMCQGKQLDVLPQEPGTEGLTYAELDCQMLQAKQGGPAPAPEAVLYATINVSWGPHGQHPRDAGGTLPPPP